MLLPTAPRRAAPKRLDVFAGDEGVEGVRLRVVLDAGAAIHRVGHTVVVEEGIVAGLAEEGVGAGAAGQAVRASAAEDVVVAGPTVGRIEPGVAEQVVRARLA